MPRTFKHHIDIDAKDTKNLDKVKDLEAQSRVSGLEYHSDGNNKNSKIEITNNELYKDIMLKRELSKPIKFTEFIEDKLGDK